MSRTPEFIMKCLRVRKFQPDRPNFNVLDVVTLPKHVLSKILGSALNLTCPQAVQAKLLDVLTFVPIVMDGFQE